MKQLLLNRSLEEAGVIGIRLQVIIVHVIVNALSSHQNFLEYYWLVYSDKDFL